MKPFVLRCRDGYVESNGRCQRADDDHDSGDTGGGLTQLEVFFMVSIIGLLIMVLCLWICFCVAFGRCNRRTLVPPQPIVYGVSGGSVCPRYGRVTQGLAVELCRPKCSARSFHVGPATLPHTCY